MTHIDTTPVVRASLWILPTGAALERIQHVMRLVHKRGGGPHFRPHVTLLSGIERTLASAELKLKHLAAQLQPFTIELNRIEWRPEYFRCFYAAAVLSDGLAAAQRAAHEVFEMNPPVPFEPHLSLLYGIIDEPLKRELAADAGGGLNISFQATGLYLVNAAAGVPVTAWKTLSERPLAAA